MVDLASVGNPGADVNARHHSQWQRGAAL